MATTRINALAAVLAANLTDVTVFPVEDALSQTRKATLAQLRTQLNAGAQSFTGAVTMGSTLQVTAAVTLSAALTVGGTLLLGSAVSANAAAGEVVLANTKSLRGTNAAGTGSAPMIRLDVNNNVLIGDLTAGSVYANVGTVAATGLVAGAATRNGNIGVDSTNNRFVYYSGGARYFLAGTAF
ncbi:MAG TPA: hypothetical protein VNJ04_12375 [Gemmatimonadaceae bacterium]|nr:hypothetical protein [Gemmatimonadaceae bacterium]